jgi:hypothetical protein
MPTTSSPTSGSHRSATRRCRRIRSRAAARRSRASKAAFTATDRSGYIPGFWGNDFEELVRDDTELRQWIEAGRLERIAENPIGKRFFERQRVAMPPFGQFLSTEEIEALMAYVRWLHAEGPRRFSQASALPSTECHRCDDVGSKRFANRARAGQEKKG